MIVGGYIQLGQVPERRDRHRLAGTVTIDGSPVSRHVSIFDRLTLQPIAAKWSDPETGAWEFKGLEQLPNERIMAIAQDHSGQYNAEVVDRLSQVTSAGLQPLVSPWLPSIALPTSWHDASDVNNVFTDFNGLTKLGDKTSNGRHLNGYTATAYPSWSPSGIVFDENDEYLYFTSPLLTEQSIFVVIETTDPTFILFGTGSQNANYGVFAQSGDTTNPISGGFGTPTYMLDGSLAAWATRNDVYLATTGRVSIIEILGATMTGWAQVRFSGYSASFPEYNFLGKLKEMIIVSGIPAIATRQSIEGYLAHKHGIQAQLPALHPYKSAAPTVES